MRDCVVNCDISLFLWFCFLFCDGVEQVKGLLED